MNAPTFSPSGLSGHVFGMTPTRASCRNGETGESVVIDLEGATVWSCAEAGLVAEEGDRVELRVQGFAR